MKTSSSFHDFQDDLELDWHPQGKAGYADHQPDGYLLRTEDIFEQIRSSIRNLGLFEEIAMGCDEHTKTNHASYPVKRSKMLFRRSKST